MKSVDKLRDYASRNQRVSGWMTALNRIADEIEREIAETEAFCRRVEEAARNNDELDVFGVAYMPLPTDADGVPIRIGDVMERTAQSGESRKVNVLKLDEHGAWWYGTTASYMYAVEGSIHYKPRTLEDVLWDFADRWSLLAPEDFDGVHGNEVISECADEIRELMGGTE